MWKYYTVQNFSHDGEVPDFENVFLQTVKFYSWFQVFLCVKHLIEQSSDSH